MEQTWKSAQYKNAAKVHFNACNFMLANIDSEKKNKNDIYLEIYYLSGYILECILKYLILEQQHKKRFTKEELTDSDVWHHDINRLWMLACEKGKIQKKDFVWNDLTKKWNSELRYESTHQEATEVLAHYSTVNLIYDKIKNSY